MVRLPCWKSLAIIGVHHLDGPVVLFGCPALKGVGDTKCRSHVANLLGSKVVTPPYIRPGQDPRGDSAAIKANSPGDLGQVPRGSADQTALPRAGLSDRQDGVAIVCRDLGSQQGVAVAIRVVQWTTGNVGKQSVEAVMKRPDLELVGCYAWSEAKAGKDIGELCGLPPIGLTATNDVDALLALEPDCVIYNPMWFNVDEMVRILESGANIVATTAFINGQSYPEDGRQRILDACAKGGSSMFGSGVSPGYIELIAVALANASDRIDHVLISEEADTTAYDSPPTEIPVGFGRPLDDPALPTMTAAATVVFSEAVALVGDALGVVFDEIVCEAEYAKTTKELDLGSWTLPTNTVAGVTIHWLGKIGSKNIVEMRVRWRKGDALEPDWEVGMGWTIEIQGRPTITTKIDILPPPYFEATTMEEFMVLGHILTALPVVNAIPAVVAAASGIVTYEDIPLPLPKGYVPT